MTNPAETQEREAFEATARTWGLDLSRAADGLYYFDETHVAWGIWQAARASHAPAAASGEAVTHEQWQTDFANREGRPATAKEVYACLAKANPAAGAEPRPLTSEEHEVLRAAVFDSAEIIHPGKLTTRERDAEDAARYRELRNGGRLFVRGDWSGYLGDYTRLSGAQLDSELDAQREQSEKRSGEAT